MSLTAVSLFCGAGGCSLGFKQAGYEILFASDIDTLAVQTYKANFPAAKCIEADIKKLDFSKILFELGLATGELDILIGGPPCQGFSTAGIRFWYDPRNALLKNYIFAIKCIKPKWFLMENVEGLLTSRKGQYVYEVVKVLVECGYKVRLEKVYSHEYGVPQRRKRVIIIGNRLGIDFYFPEPAFKIHGRIFRNSDITLRHTISGLPKPSKDQKRSLLYESVPETDWEQYLRGSATSVSEHFTPKLTSLQRERIKALKPGQTMKDLPTHLQHESFKRRANRRVMDGTPSEKRGGSPSGLKRLMFDEPCLTITGAAIREFIHPEEERPLTIREAARIQTFPDDFVFIGNSSQKIQQIGNAIPPVIARIFAEHIRENYGFDVQHNSRGFLLGYCLTKASAMSPALRKADSLLKSISNQSEVIQFNLFGDNMPGSSFLKKLFSKCKFHGTGDAQVTISDAEIYSLLYLAISDLSWSHKELGMNSIDLPFLNYYEIDLEWFDNLKIQTLKTNDVMEVLDACVKKDNDFSLYIENLCALHRRRVKYKRILSTQPLPNMDQVGPRVLLEYGRCNLNLLANWMIWRKWIYDIDNRSAQETGYLFEPVLASCLGGEAIGARNSPIKRLNSEGIPTNKGRQVDCLVSANMTAYELKLRVTIAASGQGRFGEELSFPVESRAAGYRPILLVLDPTPSDRLTELSNKFLECGGEFYQGEDAWRHMEEQTGAVISVFIDKYIKPAIQDIESIDITELQSLSLNWDSERVTISTDNDSYSISRE
ncbi:MAG: DNA cytosine methyltransferase [Prochloraceae cyanobacterium]|nr:DNA cytosine methyltransferase [Prochloraceae cyanobacterium]